MNVNKCQIYPLEKFDFVGVSRELGWELGSGFDCAKKHIQVRTIMEALTFVQDGGFIFVPPIHQEHLMIVNLQCDNVTLCIANKEDVILKRDHCLTVAGQSAILTKGNKISETSSFDDRELRQSRAAEGHWPGPSSWND